MGFMAVVASGHCGRGLHGGGGIADTGFMSVMPCMVSDGMLARSKVSLPWMALLAEKSL